MRTLKRNLGLLALLALLLAAAGCGGAQPAPSEAGSGAPPTNRSQPGRQVEFQTLQRGTYAGINQQMALLITSEADWQRHWQQHASNLSPLPPAPKVDFEQYSLVAIYMGEKSSGGYGLEVQSVQEENGMLTVRVRQFAPGPGDMVTMALTQPFQILQIPKVAPNTKLNLVWE